MICGNLAADDGNPLYTEAAPAEVVRSSLSGGGAEWLVDFCAGCGSSLFTHSIGQKGQRPSDYSAATPNLGDPQHYGGHGAVGTDSCSIWTSGSTT